MAASKTSKRPDQPQGKLRIGDDWNAIGTIALSQSNSLKAVAEFVENASDAGAWHVRIIRGNRQSKPYSQIADGGEGIPFDDEGLPSVLSMQHFGMSRTR